MSQTLFRLYVTNCIIDNVTHSIIYMSRILSPKCHQLHRRIEHLTLTNSAPYIIYHRYVTNSIIYISPTPQTHRHTDLPMSVLHMLCHIYSHKPDYQYVTICHNMSQYVTICHNMSQYVTICHKLQHLSQTLERHRPAHEWVPCTVYDLSSICSTCHELYHLYHELHRHTDTQTCPRVLSCLCCVTSQCHELHYRYITNSNV